jgi:hemerythrin-like metal-binding protein
MPDTIEWGEELKTGWPFMDDDHQRFIDLLQTLRQATDDGDGQAAAARALAELTPLMDAHFAREETAMAQSRYPLSLDHQTQHRLMSARIRDMAGRVGAEELVRLMSDWLVQHVRRHDRDLARHLARRASVGR